MPPARTAWLYAPMAAGALSVWMTVLDISDSSKNRAAEAAAFGIIVQNRRLV
ncbi:hypothetical protein AB9Q98_06440 [Neisseria gonorrhoeae]